MSAPAPTLSLPSAAVTPRVGGIVSDRTNVQMLHNALASKRQIGEALDDVMRANAKRVRVHGAQTGSGAELLNRMQHELRPGAANLVRSVPSSPFHRAVGLDPSTSSTGAGGVVALLNAHAQRNNAPGAAVFQRHLGKMRNGGAVRKEVWVDTKAYGKAVQNNVQLLRAIFHEGVPVWASLRNNSDAVCEMTPVNELNRTMLQRAESARTQQQLMLLQMSDFSAIWAPFGVCDFVAPVESSSDMYNRANAMLTVSLDAVVTIPNWWVDWPTPIAVGYDLYFVFVARTLGLEEVERELTLEGRFEEWREVYADHVRKRAMQGKLVASTVRRMRDADARAEASQHTPAAAAAAVALRIGHLPLADTPVAHALASAFVEEPIRYTRWEPYVSTDGRPPPPSFTHTTTPDGVVHKGGFRFIMRVTIESDLYCEHKQSAAAARTLLYKGYATHTASDLLSSDSSIAALPKVGGLVQSLQG